MRSFGRHLHDAPGAVVHPAVVGALEHALTRVTVAGRAGVQATILQGYRRCRLRP